MIAHGFDVAFLNKQSVVGQPSYSWFVQKCMRYL